MTAPIGFSRREFLNMSATGAAGLFVLGFQFGCAPDGGNGVMGAALPPEEGDPFEPNAFIRIFPTGAVSLTIHRSDMGQGIRTACAMLLAEELEVDLDRVRIEQADGDSKYGNQNTDGSRSVRTHYLSLRRAGAAARETLIAAAAAEWEVDASECRAVSGEVVHPGSGESLPYGDLVAAAATLTPPENPTLKTPGQFDIIGRDQSGLDIPAIVTGQAYFGADTVVDGMVYASVERSPTRGGRATAWDEAAALAVPGVQQVVEIEADPGRLYNYGLAVIASNTWAAIAGRRALNPQWQAGSDNPENSEAFARELEAQANRAGRVVRAEGDADAALRTAARVVERTFHGPYLAHAPMEPMAVVADVRSDSCEVWTPSQSPQWARTEAARVAGLSEEQTTVHVTLLGGGFGRKSKPDFVAESVAISHAISQPVKVQWTREDEIQHGWYRAQNCQVFTAGLDANGNVSAWRHRTIFPAINSSFNPDALDPGDGELGQGATNMPYRIPNVSVQTGRIAPQVRIGWLRSVCNTFHARGMGCFMDELAQEVGKDPREFLLEMLGEPRLLDDSEYPFDTGRLSGVIERVTREAGWGRELPAGQALGLAAHHSFLSYVATVARVSVENGVARVHEVHTAVDCGLIVNPTTVRAQMEGAVMFGLTYTLHGAITLENGVVMQGNFDTYPIARMSEAPETHVHLVESSAAPTGVGEPGVPPVAPAILNALARVTGRRIYSLPLTGQSLV